MLEIRTQENFIGKTMANFHRIKFFGSGRRKIFGLETKCGQSQKPSFLTLLSSSHVTLTYET